MLIKKEPIGSITVENGKITKIVFPDGKKEESCIYCKKPTLKRRMGLAECEDCQKFGPAICKKCEYGVPRSSFHCNGNDLEDHFVHWTACGIRGYKATRDNSLETVIIPFNPKSRYSSWDVRVLERKECFKEKSEECKEKE